MRLNNVTDIQFELISSVDKSIYDELQKILSDELVVRYLPITPSPGSNEMNQFFDQIFRDNSKVWLIKCNSEIVGIINLMNIDLTSASLAYFVSKPSWGIGIATKAIQYVVNYAFKELNLNQIIAPVVSRNAGSIRVLEKNFFYFFQKLDRQINFDGIGDNILVYKITKED